MTADRFTRFERDGWDRIPRAYHDLLGPVTARAADPLLDAAGVGPGSRVLDVATGPGYLAGAAARRGAEVVGVDLSPRIVALARTLNPGVAFRVADAAGLPFRDGAFDAVVAGFLLPHLADHRRALAELCRVTRPGGAVALSTWDLPERVPLLGTVVAAVAEVGAQPPADLPAGPPFFACSEDGALAGLLRGAGLDDVAVDRHAFVHVLPSADALWEAVLSGSVRTSALVAGQPEDVRRAIRAAFDRRAARYETGGALRLATSVLIGTGRRARAAARAAGAVLQGRGDAQTG